MWVLGLSNRWVWRCPARGPVTHFNGHLSDHHLDVGVGTGYYLSRIDPGRRMTLSLLDMNPGCLAAAAKRSAVPVQHAHQGDAFAPPPMPEAPFGSISLFYVLHCLPGDMAHKAEAIAAMSRLLRPGGVLYGCTILNQGMTYNTAGRKLIRVYHQKGIFGNENDSEKGLHTALAESFDDVNIKIIGRVAVFDAHRPK